MARYIDADKVHEFVNAKVAEGKDGWGEGVPYEWAYALTVIDNVPTAEVAPRAEVERLKRQLEPFKEKQCFTCKHLDIGHDHVPCCYCEDYNKYIWLSADSDTDVHTSDENENTTARAEVAREIFKDVLEKLFEMQKRYERIGHRGKAKQMMVAKCKIYKLQKKYTGE